MQSTPVSARAAEVLRGLRGLDSRGQFHEKKSRCVYFPFCVFEMCTHVFRGAPWLRQSALGLRDVALRLSGSVNAVGMLTPYYAANKRDNSDARPRTDSRTDGLNLSSYGDYIAGA